MTATAEELIQFAADAARPSREEALHPSAIQFACPPWCDRSRDDHLQDIGNNDDSTCLHTSADRVGHDTWGARWAVGLSSATYPDGVQHGSDGTLVSVGASDVELTPDQAREFARTILAVADEAER